MTPHRSPVRAAESAPPALFAVTGGKGSQPVLAERVLEFQATVLSHGTFDEAAAAFATEVASILQFDRAAIGFTRNGRTRVVATSHTADFEPGADLFSAFSAAMDEALDQGCTVSCPAIPGSRPLVALAHAELGRRYGGTVCTVPLVSGGRAFGALTLARASGGAPANDDIDLSGHELAVTCSIGIAMFPHDGLEADTVVKNAGAAMHHAKESGRNTSHYYSSELNARALQRLSLGNQLRKALERDELLLHYQPKVDVRTGEVTGAEALVRWQHPERGLVAPGEFIPLAEENGLIVPLGEWVLRAACGQANAWVAAGHVPPRIAVNVSSHQFRQGQLSTIIRGILSATAADARYLSIELTEGVIMENAEANVKALRQLKEMGLKLAIDDFGTGYSSLSYLTEFPLDELKIDRSFIVPIRQAGDRAAIVTAIIAMAHSLELSVVAEGVETLQQLEFLSAEGCDEYQGYLTSKPVPADEFAARFMAT